MKKVLLFAILMSAFFTSCTKDKDLLPETENPPAPRQEVYEFESIRFFLSPGDKERDTVRYELDTVYIFNATDIRQPDTVLYPYQAVKDSFGLKFDEQFEVLLGDAVYTDSIEVPYTVQMNKLHYNGSRDINVSGISTVNVISTALTTGDLRLSVTPNVRISVTGTYYRFVSRAGFEALFKEKHTGKVVAATGRWFSSIATTQSINGSKFIAVSVNEL